MARPRVPRFVLDADLAPLARMLRLIGLDAVLAGEHDEEPAGRVAIGRDLAGSPKIADQVLAVLVAHGLADFARAGRGFHTRCTQCNHLLLPAKPHHVTERVAGTVLVAHDRFYLCTRCERVSWDDEGTRRTRAWLAELVGEGEKH